MRRSLISAGALVAAVAGSLVLAPVASATTDPAHPTLRQELPRTATDKGAPQYEAGTCADIPATMDGWHFVLPGEKADFVELKVTFEPGGTQTITTFGPPKPMHAYVASEPGAKLVAIEATIDGTVPHDTFNLSHTCPASSTAPKPPVETPKETPKETPSDKPSDKPSETPGASASPSSAVAGEQDDKGGKDADGDLAETGSSAPVGIIAAVAVALAGVGGFLVTRRRKAGQEA